MPAHQVDVFLAVVVDGSLQTQVLVHSFVELFTEVGNLLDERFQYRSLQCQEYGVGDRTHADCRVGGAQQVGLAKVFATAKKCDAQFFAMRTCADDLSLTVCHDEELLLVLALRHEVLATSHFHGHEVASQACHNLLLDVLEERDGTQVLGCEAGHAVEILNLDAFSLLQFHLRAVHAIGATFHLRPRKELEEKSRCDTAHLRGCLGGVRQFASCCSSDAALDVVVCHNVLICN